MKDHFDNRYYDDINHDIENNYFTPIIKHLIASKNYKKICDIGCGNGIFTSHLKKYSDTQLTGVDANKYALDLASNLNFDELKLVKDFSKDVQPFADNEFDLVICKDVLEHLIDPSFLVDEIYRITSKGGYFLMHVPNHFPIWGRLKFFFTNNIDTFNFFPDSERYDFPHIRFFTYKSATKMLESNGFKIVEDLSYFFAQPPFFHRFFSLKMMKAINFLSTDNFSLGITLLARKE